MIIKCWGKNVMQSDGLPWNGWTVDLGSEDGPWSFRAGVWWQALEHLSKCEDCRRENELTLEEVKARLADLEQEWRMVIGE